MNNKHNITLFCVSFRFSNIEFKKPPFQIMKAIQKKYDISADIVFDEEQFPFFYAEKNTDVPPQYDNVNLINLSKSDKSMSVMDRYIQYLKQHAKNIDIMLLFHCSDNGAILSKYYKKLNPNGKIIDIMDYHQNNNQKFVGNNKLIQILKNIKRHLFNRNLIKFIDLCDEFTVCTKKDYRYLRNNLFFTKRSSNKITYAPYGIQFSNDENTELVKKKKFITVGRIGTLEKNTSLILEAIDGLDLKDWEFNFIGPIEDSFNMEIEEFFKKNENLKDKVKFIGAVEDRELLKQYYSESSVFVLSSKYESFGLVLVEALSFGNYLLSTDVGVASDLIEDFNYGKLYQNSEELRMCLVDIIKNGIDQSRMFECAKRASENFDWSNIISYIKTLEILTNNNNG